MERRVSGFYENPRFNMSIQSVLIEENVEEAPPLLRIAKKTKPVKIDPM